MKLVEMITKEGYWKEIVFGVAMLATVIYGLWTIDIVYAFAPYNLVLPHSVAPPEYMFWIAVLYVPISSFVFPIICQMITKVELDSDTFRTGAAIDLVFSSGRFIYAVLLYGGLSLA